MTIEEYLKRLSGMPSYLEKVSKVVEHFKNTIRIDDVSVLRLCTNELNYFVNQIDISWEDKCTVILFSYESGIPVYSDPPTFDVALLNPTGLGYLPYDAWDEQFKKHNINPDLVKKIKSALASRKACDY